MSDNIPDNGGYVAAAYLVFLAIVLLYVVIIAMRLQRLQRDLSDIAGLVEDGKPDGEKAGA